jgi:peptidoglycan L-alanyl-D-glutamate endopeptidase CwlK
MTFSLSQKSLDTMKGVKDPLVNVVKRAIEISTIDFKVLEGVRTLERQKELLARKVTQTLNSKHITGDAVDLGALKDGVITWDKESYKTISVAMKQAAKELNVNIRWGGDFKTFFDGPHFELV